MAKPVLQRINPFDANKGQTMSFTWSGNRVKSNKLFIYDNSTNAEVYTNTVVSSYSLSNVVTANHLTNGKTYYAVVAVTDMLGNTYTSDKVLFHCYTTPVFRFESLQTSIASSSYTVSVIYESPDNEPFNFCRFYLYDYDTGSTSRKQLLESAEITRDNGKIAYTYRGLENSNYYYIRAYGTTVHGMEVDTGYQRIYVHFENEIAYAPLYAESVKDRGCIHVYTNIKLIESVRPSDSYTYVENDTMIDLREDEVSYTDFGEFDDFTLRIVGKDLWKTHTIFIATNGEDKFELSSRVYGDGTLRFRLLCPSNGYTRYMIYSKPTRFTNEDLVTLFLRRENNIFQIEVLDYVVDE